jgi:hypothetical protein
MARAKIKVEPLIIFRYAEAYAAAAEMLTSQVKQSPTGIKLIAAEAHHKSPMVTLEAFSLELYLKCLHATDHGGYPGRGHDTWALFTSLKPGTQQAIRHSYTLQLQTRTEVDLVNRRERGLHPTLDRCLQDAAHLFEDMRYFFEERNRGKKIFFWPLLRTAIRNTILRSYPDWRSSALLE